MKDDASAACVDHAAVAALEFNDLSMARTWQREKQQEAQK
jgi:hypothetical protein